MCVSLAPLLSHLRIRVHHRPPDDFRDLGDDRHPRPLKAKVEPADSREEGKHSHAACSNLIKRYRTVRHAADQGQESHADGPLSALLT